MFLSFFASPHTGLACVRVKTLTRKNTPYEHLEREQNVSERQNTDRFLVFLQQVRAMRATVSSFGARDGRRGERLPFIKKNRIKTTITRRYWCGVGIGVASVLMYNCTGVLSVLGCGPYGCNVGIYVTGARLSFAITDSAFPKPTARWYCCVLGSTSNKHVTLCDIYSSNMPSPVLQIVVPYGTSYKQVGQTGRKFFSRTSLMLSQSLTSWNLAEIATPSV